MLLSSRNRFVVAPGLCAAAWAASGCEEFARDADNEVYRLITRRQVDALDQTSDAFVGEPAAPAHADEDAYAFAPHPVDSDVPEAFQTTRPAEEPPATAPAGLTTRPGELRGPSADERGIAESRPTREMSLADVLAYAFRRSRDFQTAKESLYLAALALTLERHLWTPRFMGEIRSEYTNLGAAGDFDQAMDTVAEVGVEQRLPYGGTVTAQVITALMRDLTDRVTTGETGQIILEANVPLLRGAGPAAYESRYQGERSLIYAVRTFERFRQEFAVDIAGDYFNLQQLRQEIVNARESVASLSEEVDRARAFGQKERIIALEVQRAEQNRLIAANTEVDAVEAYRTALDGFKIRIGMPVETPIDVAYPEDPGESAEPNVSAPDRDALPESAPASTAPAEGADARLYPRTLEESVQMPAVTEAEAIRVALKYRLDLLNDLDRIGDAERGVKIAENTILPDLALSGSVTWDTNPDDPKPFNYGDDRTTWRAGASLELPLDRKAERNLLRQRQIGKRQAERDYEEAQEFVRLQVRRAMRRVEQEKMSLSIQTYNRDLAIRRRAQARFMFDRQQASNRDVVDAENDLLRARNRLAQAQSRVRLAILEFRRDTGTLRIDEEGRWDRALASGAEER